LKNPRITFGVQWRKNAPKQALSVSSAAPRRYLLRKSHLASEITTGKVKKGE
jgi:hypothetical protein